MKRIAQVILGGFVWLGGCSSTSEGVTVAMEIEPPARASAADVVITRGFVNVESVEIFACGATASWLDVVRMRAAHAHVVGSPTLLGVPATSALFGGGRTAVGELRPPPGSYCRVKHTFAPADGDALGLPADGSMARRTVLVEGTAPRAFSLTSTDRFTVESTLPALELQGAAAAKLVLTNTGEGWFAGVDFGATDEEIMARVVQNLRGSFGVRVE